MECPKCHAENKEDSHFCGNCAMPLGKLGPEQASLTKTLETPVHVLKAGSLIAGKYRILEEIGRGGMGIVYKVEDTQLKRTAALKFLSPDSTAIPSREKRFAQEAQIASALNHPNICTIYEVGEAEGNSYIAMEYVEGRPLDRMIPPGGLPPDDVLRFGSQIVEAFEHAHETRRHPQGPQDRQRDDNPGRAGQGPRLRVGQTPDHRGARGGDAFPILADRGGR